MAHWDNAAVTREGIVLLNEMMAGHELILVSSGAIAMGVGKMNLARKPDDIPSKQALAAVGQCELMYIYDKLFSEYNHTVAQILLTGADVEDPGRRENFRNTMFRLLELGALPVINENDTVATSEIAVGDNDTLAAIAAVNIQADLLALMSDIEGLYTADPRKDPDARLIGEVHELTEEVLDIAAGGDCLAVLYGERLVVYRRDLTEYARLESTDYAGQILVEEDGSVLLISGSSAWRFLP